MAYLDLNGLSHFLTKIEAKFATIASVPLKSSTTPKANGTAAAGSETAWAAGDHVHPTDTTRAPLASPTFTGTPKAPTATAGTNTTQLATCAFVKAAVDGIDSGVVSVAGKTGAVTLVTADISDLDAATTSAAGLMSSADKTKLNGIESGAQAHVAPTKSEVTTALGYTPPQTDTNTTYTLTQDASDGHKITLTPSSGTATTITIPDSDTKALGSMTGTLGVGHGGTGATTLTGIVKGNGTSAMSAATASDVKTLLGTTAVNRAAADEDGNNIASTYAKKSDMADVYHYKGSVATASGLPASPSTGDVYNIEAASAYGGAGANVAWNGTAWDSLGEIFSITAITNAEIDALFAA